MKSYKELHAEFVEKMEAILADLKTGEPISQAVLARLIVLNDRVQAAKIEEYFDLVEY